MSFLNRYCELRMAWLPAMQRMILYLRISGGVLKGCFDARKMQWEYLQENRPTQGHQLESAN